MYLAVGSKRKTEKNKATSTKMQGFLLFPDEKLVFKTYLSRLPQVTMHLELLVYLVIAI
jgi:hypothetical protein